MSDLFWPGDERAGSLMSEAALLTALESVEAAWLAALVDTGVAPESARHRVTGLLGPGDLDSIAREAEAAGNPVLGLVRLLRERLGDGDPARWLHRGLTSQDVLDTAMMLLLREVLDELSRQVHHQVLQLVRLADTHRTTVMVGRTLTQHAVPITFGLKTVVWLTGVLDAAEALAGARSRLGVQLGGAAGTMAATVELARLRGLPDPSATVWQLLDSTAEALGLPSRPPWHTARSPLTSVADALVGCTDAWGHLAADVTTLSRSEIGELAEGRAGGSSTMPDKRNPALAVLIRRAALTGPPLAATVHLAAATAVDERPDGAWHAEWAPLRDLARRTLVAGSQTSDLLADLQVDVRRMQSTVSAAGLPAEQRSMADLAGGEPTGSYLGVTQEIIAKALARAHRLEADR